MGGTIECVKYALRQTKDGMTVTFVIHPNDISPELISLPIGARVAIKWAEITDEQPSGDDAPPSSSPVTAAPQGGSTTAATSPKKHIPFDEKPLSQQAGIRCGDAEFKAFLHYNFPDIFKEAAGDCAAAVRNLCNVNSRTELDIDPSKARTWRNLNDAYETWFITKVHGNTYR